MPINEPNLRPWEQYGLTETEWIALGCAAPPVNPGSFMIPTEKIYELGDYSSFPIQPPNIGFNVDFHDYVQESMKQMRTRRMLAEEKHRDNLVAFEEELNGTEDSV